MSVCIIVPGTPVPAARPRVTRHGSQTYMPAGHREHVENVQTAWMMRGRPVLDGPVSLNATFTFQRPKSHYRTGRYADKLRHDAPVAATGRNLGDGDNLLKLVADALSGLAFTDDSMIVRWVGEKRWGPEAQTVIYLAGGL